MSGLESTAVFWLSQLLTAPFSFSPTLTYVDSPYGFPLFTPPAEKEQNDYLLPLLPPSLLPPPWEAQPFYSQLLFIELTWEFWGKGGIVEEQAQKEASLSLLLEK